MSASDISPADHPPPRFLDQSHRWIWCTIFLSFLVCAVVSWLHIQQRQTLEIALSKLDNIRQARIDLGKGILHVTQADSPESPFARTEGIALIMQAIDLFEQALSGVGGVERQYVEAFRRSVVAFEAQLEDVKRGGMPDPRRSVALRSAFDDLERRADYLDIQTQKHLRKLSGRLDFLFTVVLGSATVLLSIICGFVIRSVRSEERANAARTSSEERLGYALQFSHTGGWELDLGAGNMRCTLEYDRIFGYEPPLPEWSLDDLLNHVVPEDRPAVERKFREDVKSKTDLKVECRIRRKDGQLRWIRMVGGLQCAQAGQARFMSGILQDISERKAMEEDLHNQTLQLEEELAVRQMAQETLQNQTVILEKEVEERRRAEEALKESEATIRKKLKAILEPEVDISTLELSDIVDCDMLQSMLEDFYKLTGMLGAVLDVSGKVLVAVGWQDICTKYHRCHPETLKNCMESDTILTSDVPAGEFKHYRCKNSMWDMVTPLVVGGRHVGNIFIGQFFYEDETPDVELFREQARRYGFDEVEYLAALSRVPRFSRETARAGIQFYAKLTGMVSTLSFSSLKVARMLTERIHLEEQLRQSQKMEAVGQLAGGIAHDFNNILTVIYGFGSMLALDERLNQTQKERVDQILISAEKAAQLTKGLLAFSRKQVMTLAQVNLNEIVQHVKKMLVRIIGEDIQLKTVAHENHLVINADPGQIEQVLINLATNARDAMQKGGMFTIETGLSALGSPIDQEPGRTEPRHYALLAVSDNGCGMDAETCQRIFEPFFTTKEVGKGTGLGMAIVYGIINQHGGFIDVSSKPGQGTTFKMYLPICEAKVEKTEIAMPAAAPQGGTETILLAEDDPDVRSLVVVLLTEYGYNVIQAVDGEDVVEKAAANKDRVAIILMDMIMPKKNGKEAYEEIMLLQPNIKVLYLSGYTADYIQNRGVSEEGIELIMKPVQPVELLRKVREMIDK